MSETIWATMHAVAAVSCVWFPAHAKDAKSLLEQALGFVRREIEVLANHVYVTIEAAGSGKVLLPQLQVQCNTLVQKLKKRIFDEFCKTYKDWSSWRDICLFQGHGGPELDETRVRLVCNTTLVLATRHAKTGVFFDENCCSMMQYVFLTNKYLVTQSCHVANVWNLWTGECIRCMTDLVLSVGDELLVTGESVQDGTQLDVCTVKDHVRKYTCAINDDCLDAFFLLQHDTLLVAVSECEIYVHDVANKCQLWTQQNNHRNNLVNMRISPTGDLVTFTVDGTRHFMSQYVSNGFATAWHETLCHVPKPTLIAYLVHGHKNVMVVRTTC